MVLLFDFLDGRVDLDDVDVAGGDGLRRRVHLDRAEEAGVVRWRHHVRQVEVETLRRRDTRQDGLQLLDALQPVHLVVSLKMEWPF